MTPNKAKAKFEFETKQEFFVPASNGVAFKLQAGEFVELIDPNGQQPADFWAFNANDLEELLSAEHTRVYVGRLFPEIGQSFVTNHRRPILQLIADSCGIHDMLTAACDRYRYAMYGVDGWHPSCAENLETSMKGLGLKRARVAQPVNFFTNVQIRGDGVVETLPPPSKAGDHVILRAWIDCIIVISACPQEFNPVAGYFPTDLSARILVYNP